MKIPIDGIQAFVAISESGSFNRAAEVLNITQTGLTRRLQRLEAFLQLRLLDRSTRRVALTPVGREFLPTAKRLVDDLVHGVERLRSTARFATGDVTMATLQSVAFRQLPIALKTYAERYPSNRVRLLERSGSLVTEAVRAGEADFGIHIQQQPQSDLEEAELVRDPIVLVCDRNHPVAARSEMKWRELAGVDVIALGGGSGNRRLVEHHLGAAGLPSRTRFTVETTPTAMALAAAGVGVAILPAAIRQASVATSLVEIPLTEPIVHRSISLVRRRGETMTPATQALYELCLDTMRYDGKHK